MNYFDSLYKFLMEADLPGLAPNPSASPALGATDILGMPAGAPVPNPASALPQTKQVDVESDTNRSVLISQKKLQLTKLIALSLKTPIPDTGSSIIHKLRTLNTKPVVQGNASSQEEIIIKSIAKIQNRDVKDILSQIKYIPAETEDETSTNFIAPDEYVSLVSLARSALTAAADNIGGLDRAEISVYDITPNNIDDKLKEFKNLLSQSL